MIVALSASVVDVLAAHSDCVALSYEKLSRGPSKVCKQNPNSHTMKAQISISRSLASAVVTGEMPRKKSLKFNKTNFSNRQQPLIDPEKYNIRVDLSTNRPLVDPYITDDVFESLHTADPNIAGNSVNRNVQIENEVGTSISTTSFYGSTPAKSKIIPNIPDYSSDDSDLHNPGNIQTFGGDIIDIHLELSDDEIESTDGNSVEQEIASGARRKIRPNKSKIRENLVKKTAAYNSIQKPDRPEKAGLGLFNVDLLLKTVDAAIDAGSICEECGGHMEANVTNNDLDSGIYMQCTKCLWIGDYQDIKTLTENHISEGTTGLVSHTLDTGGGYEDLSKLISKMNLNTHIAKRRFYKIKSEVQKTTDDTYQKYKTATAEAVFKHYEEEGVEPCEDGVLNVAVSCDGTWLTRGHKSLFGAAFIVEADTGLVLDYDVMSKFCMKCVQIKAKYKNDQEKLVEKVSEHKETGECKINYEGTAGGMEKNG